MRRLASSYTITYERANRGHTDEINQIKCNGRATRLASCSDDKTARIWNVEDPNDNEVVVLKGHKNAVSTMGWCPHTPAGQNELLATWVSLFSLCKRDTDS